MLRLRYRLAFALMALGLTRPASAQSAAVVVQPEFTLPIFLDPPTRESLKELKLYVRLPSGDWRMEQAVPSNAAEFRVKVDRGGLYGFRVVVVDHRGQHFPDRLAGTEPQTWVEVRLPKAVAPPEAVKVELPVQPPTARRTDSEMPKIVMPEPAPVIDVRPQEPETPAKPIVIADPLKEPTPEPKVAEAMPEPKMVEPPAPVKARIRSVTADPNDIRIRAVRPAKE